MDSRSTFLPRRTCVNTDTGTVERRAGGRSGLAVQPRRRGNWPRRECEATGQPNAKRSGVDTREKLCTGVRAVSVP